jgi:hypothetical protein
MKRALQFGLAMGVLLGSSLLCLPVQAQHIGASVARPMAIQPRATYSRRFVPRPIGSLPQRANHAVPSAFNATGFAGSGLTLQQLLDPVPPPGFDYQYLSAIDGDLAVKALIDPVTQWRVAEAERTLRATGGFAGSSFYLMDGGGYYLPEESEEADQSQQPQPQPQPSQQPQIIVLQQAPPTQPAAQLAPEAEAAPAAAPVPDVGQFILVLRNGTRIQAVAFTSSGGNIVYITADGGRRTIAVADLDSAMTVRVNEERGTPLQLPL